MTPPSPRTVVVGNLTLDDVVLPDGTVRMAATGGNAIYAALGARLWDQQVGLVARRGDDFPAAGLDELAALGVDTSAVVDVAGPTVRNWVIYEEDGRRTWVYRTPPNRYLEVAVRPQDLPASWLAGRLPPVVHIAAMSIGSAEALVAKLRRAAPSSPITLDTHEDYVRGYRDRLLDLAGAVTAFLPSREELADLVGFDDPPRAIRELSSLPTPIVVVKMGAEGALVWDRRTGTLTALGASAGPVVDVTGAGDAFCGGFAAGLRLGLDPVEAARRGAVSAAFAVAEFTSLHLARVRPEDAQARLRDHPPAVGSATSASKPSGAGPAPRPEERAAISVMRDEIAMIPQAMVGQLAALDDRITELARSLAARGTRHLFAVGCGDSMFAGAAACLAFARQAGIDGQAVHAMEMARYRVRYLPPGSAVVCISFSGQVGRTIEAAAQARAFGHRVIALTARADGRLAKEASETVLLEDATLGFSPGTSSYTSMLLALLHLSVRLGEARGTSAGGWPALEKSPELARATLEATAEPMREVAGRIIHQPWVSFIGAGPNEASARFGAAKLVEGPQILGVATNLEEWAHEEYFVTARDTPVVMIAPAGASLDRAAEILSELEFLGADATLVTDAMPPPGARTIAPLASGLPEEFTPLLASLPLSLLAWLVSGATGRGSYDFPSPEAEREHYETIHRHTRGEPA